MERSTRKRKQVDYSYGGFAEQAEDDDWEKKKSTKTKKAPNSATPASTKRKNEQIVDDEDEFGFDDGSAKQSAPAKSGPPKRLSMQEKREQAELNRALELSKKETQNAENSDPELELDDLTKGSSKDQALITNFTKRGGAARLPSPDVIIDLEGGSDEDVQRQKPEAKPKKNPPKITEDSDASDASISELSGLSEPESDASDYGSKKKKPPPKMKPSPASKKSDTKPKPTAKRTTKRKSDEMKEDIVQEDQTPHEEPTSKRTRRRVVTSRDPTPPPTPTPAPAAAIDSEPAFPPSLTSSSAPMSSANSAKTPTAKSRGRGKPLVTPSLPTPSPTPSTASTATTSAGGFKSPKVVASTKSTESPAASVAALNTLPVRVGLSQRAKLKPLLKSLR
ncbi:hypothetical protein HK097_009815 [Rhizophlyctis rosea]|uniref:Uncharacterized protein n=1 Tax=Rhizophlyctis rosea TaxID=64517 RepID=A0AAD5SBJ2_9FUNG|nr:hypothetical protein HK097_009815 [Rhizophlyctis rosea]